MCYVGDLEAEMAERKNIAPRLHREAAIIQLCGELSIWDPFCGRKE